VKEDVMFGDKQLSKGERIFAMLVAANRDPRVFDKPDEFILNREPNPHMTFGKGAHHCMGMPLARNEGKIAVPLLLERFKNIEIMEDMNNIPWINSMVTRGPTRLPVKLS
jgi:cytochrome P450